VPEVTGEVALDKVTAGVVYPVRGRDGPPRCTDSGVGGAVESCAGPHRRIGGEAERIGGEAGTQLAQLQQAAVQ